MPTMIPNFLPDSAATAWAELDTPTATAGVVVDPDMVATLPVPVARWLRHSIAPGTPLRSGVQVSMHGDIRIKKWMPFTADQIVAPVGYIWAARAGRFASELIGLTPAGALAPNSTWHGIDDHRAVATITIDGEPHAVTVTVDDVGTLTTISLPRWANPDKGPFQLHSFGVMFDGEFTTAGYTLARTISAGWWPATPRWVDGEFFRATLDHVRFF